MNVLNLIMIQMIVPKLFEPLVDKSRHFKKTLTHNYNLLWMAPNR